MSAEILHFFGVIDAPNRIRELRMALRPKRSQQWLGEQIGVSKVTISDLELGKMRLDVEYMRRIARAIGVDPADLLPRSDNAYALSTEERRLIDQLRTATPEQREQVQRVADVLVPWKGAESEAA